VAAAAVTEDGVLIQLDQVLVEGGEAFSGVSASVFAFVGIGSASTE